MGTSSAYRGAGRGGGLLPSLTPDPDGEHDAPGSAAPADQDSDVAGANWGALKAQLTRFASEGGAGTKRGEQYLRNALGGYVRAQGGGRRAAKGAVAGRASAGRLGGFLTSLVTSGVESTAQTYGLTEFLGQDADTFLAAVVDRLASDGAGLEDAAARAAMTDTLQELFEEYSVAEEGLESLETLEEQDAREVLIQFLGNYIFERLVQVLARKLEDRNPREVHRLETEIRDYIRNTLALDLSDVDILTVDFGEKAGREIIERIFEEGHSLLDTL